MTIAGRVPPKSWSMATDFTSGAGARNYRRLMARRIGSSRNTARSMADYYGGRCLDDCVDELASLYKTRALRRSAQRDCDRCCCRFTKMHGCGNDFVVLDLLTQHFQLKDRHVRKLADRHFRHRLRPGVERSKRRAASMSTFATGFSTPTAARSNNAAMARAALRVTCAINASPAKIRSASKRWPALSDYRSCAISRCASTWACGVLSRRKFHCCAAALLTYPLSVGAEQFEIGAVSMGNPHAVLLVDDVKTAPVADTRPADRNASEFSAARQCRLHAGG